MIAFVMILFHVLGVISSFHAVMGARTSQGAIAWVVSLITFPYIAVPAYWILGRSRFQGYVKAFREGSRSTEQFIKRVRADFGPYLIPESEKHPAGKAAEGLTDVPSLKGNRVELLVDGDATFASIIDGIERAESYILFQFFIVHDDNIGRRLKNHLMAKAAAGVRVFFLYDEIGSHDLPASYKDALSEAGVEVFAFNTRKGTRNRFQINFRNHRKVVVVDGRTAWIGGHNVGDEYLGKDPKFGHWRDTHVKIEGPSVLAAQLSFVEDWHWASGAVPEVSWVPVAAAEGDLPVLIVPSGPADDLETAALMFLHAINTAQERIWIATPYFVPDDAIVAALQLAGLRGVDVRILIPEKPDHLLVYLAGFSYFDDASKTGVRFFRYTDGFLHEKAMLIDDRIATIGTANFDNRSFRLNFEITTIVADPLFAAEVKLMFLEDFAKAREMAKNELADKLYLFKVAVRLARLTSPVQ